MRQVYAAIVIAIALSVSGSFTLNVIAQNYPTTVSYNPNNSGASIFPPSVDAEKSDGLSMDKTSLLTIPQAFTKPNIDGIFDPGEWADAVTIVPLTVVRPGTRIYMKNDACYLYVAAEIVGNPPRWYGNSNMINIWFDVNANGQWDGPNDGNLGLPAPGFLYPPNVASWGYNTLSGWTTCSTCRLRFQWPWLTPGVVQPEALVKVRIFDVPPNLTYMEAQIDYVNGPVKLTGGTPFNMRIQSYAGYYTGGGSVQIQSQWPTISGAAYFNGPTPSQLTDVEITPVVAAGNFYDITETRVKDNPTFSSKAYITGTYFEGEIDYVLNDPPPQTIDYRARFYGPYPNNSLVLTHAGSVNVTSASGTAVVQIPVNIPIGFYTVEFEADDPEVCGIEPVLVENNILMLGPGQVPCSVYPGDVNVDGIVNYGDIKALNNYIHDANLNPNWLTGYYRLAPNFPYPLAEIEYIGQAALPWNQPEGCYMDTDGSGVVNSFDYIAIKMNWFKTHDVGASPKQYNDLTPASFGLAQNYPNPFNPSTNLEYSVPEPSHVSLVVTDIHGKTVSTLIRGTAEPGIHNIKFNADELASGQYIATINMIGEESGLSFSKSVKMTLLK